MKAEHITQAYQVAKERYAAIGVDTDAALKKLQAIKISMHCWQGDDIKGFDREGPLTGGIQVTGNYPGKARNPEELMDDIIKVFSLVPAKHKLNLHSNYSIFKKGKFHDRDKLEPEDFKEFYILDYKEKDRRKCPQKGLFFYLTNA